ncbi:MAG: molybdate ABC transporter substrate-binding protein [Myxococcales bacterium]|nr:molybdate ABC transporter substrate-binding protein [Myxococcales bacterium]
MSGVVRFTALVGLIALALSLVGCKRGEDARGEALAVYAATSLTEAFTDLERSFEAAHPGVDVIVTFAGSQVLRLQIEQGAAADVYASANLEHMGALVDAGLVEGSEAFAHNELVVIVPRDNPANITRFDELPRASRVVIGASTVPVGVYTRALLGRAGPAFSAAVMARVVSEEANVRLVRAKVELGEVDAAIVYRTDAIASTEVTIIDVPADLNVRADYHIAPLTRATKPTLARQFIAHVRGPGSAALERRGFSIDS